VQHLVIPLIQEPVIDRCGRQSRLLRSCASRGAFDTVKEQWQLRHRLHSPRPRKCWRHSKLLFVSGFAGKTVVDHKVGELEANFLQKPYTLQTLAQNSSSPKSTLRPGETPPLTVMRWIDRHLPRPYNRRRGLRMNLSTTKWSPESQYANTLEKSRPSHPANHPCFATDSDISVDCDLRRRHVYSAIAR
jgi:hypothetical protein